MGEWGAWENFWTWFYGFTEFFAIVFGPVILGSLPILSVVVLLLAAALAFIDGIFGLFIK